MGSSEDQELHITVSNSLPGTSSQSEAVPSPSDELQKQGLNWWIKISICILLILLGQSTAVLLGRLYYNNGGKSKWMVTLVQFVGFPVLLPLYCIIPKEVSQENTPKNLFPCSKVASIYIFLGLIGAGASMMYSIGLEYMPVSTFSLICASQLAFNAVFSFFLNSQKFTPFITNSLVLLTISSALLVFQTDSSVPEGESKENYTIGILCAIGNAAGYGLSLSVTEFTFQRILKNGSFKATLDMIISLSLVASCVSVVGLVASGEVKTLKEEMDRYKVGKLSYMMTLIWTALSWQVYTIGTLGVIVKVSSLFSNVVATVGLPIVPILAAIFFHDSLDGIKIVAILLAVWGFVSYTYQEYLDLYTDETTNPVTTNAFEEACENRC
ncbi:purine permease 21-like [Chenopodium quinoa]|uniref:Probable purine permease n=1 Tax=Chenopodium quinoa TaxID=63459 RepID=A0A803MDP1_CHEQI|nr:purine permease 21-like [Chenopodium quinoa]